QDGSLWYHVICAIHGVRLEQHSRSSNYTWGTPRSSFVGLERVVTPLKDISIRVGDGSNTMFWLDTWILDSPLYVRFLRLFALESVKDILVAIKWSAPSLDASFRRRARDGAESNQWSEFCSMLDSVTLSSSPDRIFCDLNGEGVFRVKDIRSSIDDTFLPSSDSATRWVKTVPINVNIFAWRTRLDRLPIRVNLITRGVNVDSSLCPVCSSVQKDSNHLFFLCDLGKSISQRICRWWNIQWVEVSTYAEWYSWFISIRLPAKLKLMLEGVFYTSWWHICFRNRVVFDSSPPRRAVIFDDIVATSFIWSVNRCSSSFFWSFG
nr:RNA-directed DNA polymerase, eukaryota [Tanacetum cinerariifolium]